MKNIRFSLFGISLAVFMTVGCTNDLNTEPKVELTLEQLLAQDPNAINGIMSKLYGAYALSGPNGAGSSDISDDAGESPFLRGIINLEEFTADGMKNRWGDNGLDQLTTTSNWDGNNKFFRYLYNRVYYMVPQCNNVINVLDNVSVPNGEQLKAETRFLRALAYYYMIDCFGKGVIVPESNTGSIPLPQSSRVAMFEYVEDELLAIEDQIPMTNDYGRANRSAVRMVLAKLYLNAEVYTGSQKYSEAATYAKKVIDEGGYTLATNFRNLFSQDNNITEAKNEIIYPLIADPVASQSYGNTTYIIQGSTSNATMNPLTMGLTGDGWGGHRATKAWYGLFGSSAAALASSPDVRAQLFWTNGHSFEMNDYKKWTDGYPSIKFTNQNSTNNATASGFAGTDFPLFRLADAYLMYAECAIRNAAGTSMTQGLTYINNVRTRAGATPIILGDMTLDFILDERGRELNLEGHRRTDLIRFGKFGGSSHVWPWKGGLATGTTIPSTYNLFPIPTSALAANPNLTQNPGY